MAKYCDTIFGDLLGKEVLKDYPVSNKDAEMSQPLSGQGEIGTFINSPKAFGEF